MRKFTYHRNKNFGVGVCIYLYDGCYFTIAQIFGGVMQKVVTVPKKVERVAEVVVESETKIVEEPGGLITLMQQEVCFLCMNYFYGGVLVGVNTTCVELKDPYIIYETGEWTDKKWKDAQRLPTPSCFVNLEAIECFFVPKR